MSWAAPRLFAGAATDGAVPLAACPPQRPLPFLLAADMRDTILPFGGRARPPAEPSSAPPWLGSRTATAARPHP